MGNKKKKALRKRLKIAERIIASLAGIAEILYVIYQILKG